MNTPPRRTSRPRTPTAPRHAPTFEEYSPRRSLRLKKDSHNNATLSPPPSSPLAQTPSPVQKRKKKATFALEDNEEELRSTPRGRKGKGRSADEEERYGTRQTLRNPAGVGLPTPAKTPSRKRRLDPTQVASSAQALFPPTEVTAPRRAAGSGLFGVRGTPVAASLAVTPKRKPVSEARHQELEIFTDSSERRPKVDLDPDNPFITRPGEETRSSKRIRQKKADLAKSKLNEDTRRSDGMVYIFRGKKIFRSFDSIPDLDDRAASEDEEEELGLNPANIKPRRLFSPAAAAQQNIDDDRENLPEDEIDEEAETEVDEASSIIVTSKKSSRRSVASRMTPDTEDEIPKLSPLKSRGSLRSRRISGSKAAFDGDEDDIFGHSAAKGGTSSDEEIIFKGGLKRRLHAAIGSPSTPTRLKKRTKHALA